MRPQFFKYDTVKPKKSKNVRVTSVHGSMTAKGILNVVKEHNKKNEEKEKKKKESKERKQKATEMFLLCKEDCKCEKINGKCVAISLKQCTSCHSVLKSQCSKKACRAEDGSKPAMTKVVEAKNKTTTQISVSSSDEFDEGLYYDYDSDVF